MPAEERSWGHLKTGLSLSQERTADSCTIHMGFESPRAVPPVTHVGGCREDNVASLLWPHCLFTHRDLLASFSMCQHLLSTPEQGHHVADAPRRDRHLVTEQQLLGRLGAAPSLHLGLSHSTSLSFQHPQAGCNFWKPPDLLLHPQLPLWGRAHAGDDLSGLGTCRRSLKMRWLCRADPMMDTGSSVYFKFYRGHFPLPGVGE